MDDSLAALKTTWKKKLAPYSRPNARKATTQILNSFLPFVATWYLMLLSLDVSYFLTLLLAIPAAGFAIRLFIVQHDCGHGSFFRSRHLNNSLGFLLGVLTLMPYHYWRRTHAMHHATSGNLDHREFGDIALITVREYLERSRWQKLGYRLYRHPVTLFLVGPVYQFVLKHRFPFDAPRSWKKEWLGLMATNLLLATVIVALSLGIGFDRFLMVQAPITVLSGSIGVFLFYVQHQFEHTYWEKDDDWEFAMAGLHGSSFLDMPALLHWFTGNIGYHHIHHLSSRIPNYNLRRCSKENEELNRATRITLRDGLKSVRLKLWDEDRRRLIGFRELRSLAS